MTDLLDRKKLEAWLDENACGQFVLLDGLCEALDSLTVEERECLTIAEHGYPEEYKPVWIYLLGYYEWFEAEYTGDDWVLRESPDIISEYEEESIKYWAHRIPDTPPPLPGETDITHE